MAILITGGAGYIGSVTTEILRARGEQVVVLDNLSRGHRDAVAPEIPFYEGNVGDRELVTRIVASTTSMHAFTSRRLRTSESLSANRLSITKTTSPRVSICSAPS